MADPAQSRRHVEKWEKYYSETNEGTDVDVLVELDKAKIGWATQRIADNQRKNKFKEICQYASFIATALAIVCNVLTLLWFTHPF